MFEDEVKIKLRDLGNLVSYGDTIKVIGSGTGKTLIQCYDKKKHEHLGDLEITGIFTELSVGGATAKNWCKSRLVAWASDYQYKKLKEGK